MFGNALAKGKPRDVKKDQRRRNEDRERRNMKMAANSAAFSRQQGEGKPHELSAEKREDSVEERRHSPDDSEYSGRLMRPQKLNEEARFGPPAR